jgi:hypothetical protein
MWVALSMSEARRVLSCHDDGEESVVDVVVFPEAIMMVAKDAAGFCVL